MTVGAISFFSGFVAYLFLCLLLLVSWRGNSRGRWMIFAAGVTAVWCAVLGIQENFRVFPAEVVWTADIVRTYVWLAFLGKLLRPDTSRTDDAADKPEGSKRIRFDFPTVVAAGQTAYIWGAAWLESQLPQVFRPVYQLFGHIVLALAGLVLIEQYFRNTRTDLRWRIKFFCFALGGVFAYDFYVYSDALLFQRVNPGIWAARGAVAALMTPLLAVSAARNPDWSLDVFVSRQAVFHSATLIGAGIYLLLMATAGYYIRIYGGEWGTVAQAVFLVGAFVILAVLLFSGQMRARMRVFLSKNFFNYAYDYRQEWLRIINTLSDTRSELPLEQRIIMALGQVVESPSGVLWVRESQDKFLYRASFGDPHVDIPFISSDDLSIRQIEDRDSILNLDEMVTMPEAYHGLTRPVWLEPYDKAWLVVPLFREEKNLYGVLLLTEPRTQIHWTWEVVDLLKTSGRLAASYLALEDAGRALAQARQFEGFNRLSAFVIHDLKNLIGQLTLVVRNAERHQNNPEFMRDAIRTVDHATGKMSRLMSQLRNFGTGDAATYIELGALLGEVVKAREGQTPVPECRIQATRAARIMANRDRLASALEHIIHNAQDAAGKHGRVCVRLRAVRDDHAVVEIEDNGHGMDEEFIRTRLFRPFDTTKGLTGMGIGAYESREYIRSLGGDLIVRSEPGKGATFTFLIPLSVDSVSPAGNEVATA